MTISEVREAARLLGRGIYRDNLADDGTFFDPEKIFDDLMTPPIVPANQCRLEIVERIVAGRPYRTDKLSDWAMRQLPQWQADAETLIAMGVTGDPPPRTLDTMFRDEQNWQLDAVGDGYTQSIDRDQAINDDGEAAYNSYIFISTTTGRRYPVSALEMEEYARTW
jgi:hypothetical protein